MGEDEPGKDLGQSFNDENLTQDQRGFLISQKMQDEANQRKSYPKSIPVTIPKIPHVTISFILDKPGENLFRPLADKDFRLATTFEPASFRGQ